MSELHRIGLATFALLGLIIANNIPTAHCVPDTTITFMECNTDTWATNDPYGDNVAITLDQLARQTPSDPSYAKYLTGSYGGTTVYAYSKCERRLSQIDCYVCLDFANQQLHRSCRYAIGAQIEMVDCRMRYESYVF